MRLLSSRQRKRAAAPSVGGRMPASRGDEIDESGDSRARESEFVCAISYLVCEGMM